ncbi:hypothetical protein Pla123a_02620 [Posidoniimonas polymericola]|uniref:VanZ like family protein n=1 Tax=Posidoniimonas polymericola TaxID=2528002 RepID=A0A5C5ZE64_9BACT|nr:hypothetical protein [Posidoniimonas polymericola]TWT85455.1 hypothetical protein Pla123a_02620 [Posidoniimonas polymericola]
MRWILSAYVLFGAAMAVFADLGQYPPGISQLHALPMGDKLLHLMISGGFALLLNCWLIGSRWGKPWRTLLWGTLIAAALCTVEEATNLFTPYRGAELLDLAANYAGILLIGAVPVALHLLIRPPAAALPQANPLGGE